MLFKSKKSQNFKENGRFEVDISMKMQALDDPFSIVPPADKMIIFLRQHIGIEATSTVKKGDLVKCGQKIGDNIATDSMGVPIHSPVDGAVDEIVKMRHPISGNEESAVIIKTTNEGQGFTLKPIKSNEATKDELLKRVREAGIVGLGGASFPTHIKLAQEKKITHLIINGKESDPNIACDFRLMIEKPQEIVEGIQIMAKILDVDKIIFATRTQENQTSQFDEILEEKSIDIVRIEPNYSVGSEKLLVKELLDKEVPCGKYPPHIGVVVHNLATAYAVSRAVNKGEPLISKGLTFYSKKTKGKNLWVRMGTPVDHIIKHIGLSPNEFERIVLGSILMGPTIPDPSFPILKATSGITAYTKEEIDPYKDPLPCIRCAYCNTVCPVDIYPQLIMEAEKKGDVKRLKILHVETCIECGLCSYVCPSRIKFTKYLTGGKQRIRGEEIN